MLNKLKSIEFFVFFSKTSLIARNCLFIKIIYIIMLITETNKNYDVFDYKVKRKLFI